MSTSGSFRTTGYSDPGYPDRYVFSWSLISQSVEGNYSDISWSLKADGGSTGGYYTIVYERYVTVNGSTQSNSSEQTTYNGTTPFSGTTRIYHNADGKKSFSASAGGAFYYSGSYNSTGSGSWDLPDIPRKANITGATDFTDESNPTIQYSNLAGNNVTSLQACISFDSSKDDIAYRDISKTGTSYTFNLTEAERNVLRNGTKSSKSRSVIFYVKTVIGGNTYYSTLQKTLTIVNANPTFSSNNVSYSDTNTTVTNITNNNQQIVQNKSNLKVTYTQATGKKGATISKYKFVLNGVTKESTSAGGTVDFGAINSANNLNLSVTVTDSRGYETTISKTITMLEYNNPSAIVTLNRLNNYENETYLTVDGTVASVNSKNAMTIQYRYKESGGNYNSYTTIQDNAKQTLQLDKNKSFIFNVLITDSFGSTFNQEYSLGKGIFPFFIDTVKNSVGINCFPKNEKSLEIEGTFIFNNKKLVDLIYPVGSIYISVNNVSPQTFLGGTWEAFATGRTLVGVDTSQTEFNSVGKTGGAKTHALTVAQMPSHEGHMYDNMNGSGYVDRNGDTNSYYLNSDSAKSYGYGQYENRPYKIVSGNEMILQGYSRGGGQAHNNLQPYITCYMFKRTA